MTAILIGVTVLMSAHPASAQRFRRTDRELTKGGNAVKSAFRPAVAKANKSTVLVRCDGENAALGAVVGADGWIVTKASELHGDITCTLSGGKSYPARITGVADEHDLAMLKIGARGLAPLTWGDASTASVGQWVATTGAEETPVAVGVLSVGRRKITGRSGLLGVMLADGEGGAKIVQVVPESPAERARLLVDDVITAVNGRDVASREALVGAVRRYSPGQEVTVSVRRGEKAFDVRARLAGSVGEPSRDEIMNRMGGALSNRSANFPAVLQHDSFILPHQCGGPLVTLDGKAVGLNIARAGRVETYALPADVVTSLLTDLKSGKLAPPDKSDLRKKSDQDEAPSAPPKQQDE